MCSRVRGGPAHDVGNDDLGAVLLLDLEADVAAVLQAAEQDEVREGLLEVVLDRAGSATTAPSSATCRCPPAGRTTRM